MKATPSTTSKDPFSEEVLLHLRSRLIRSAAYRLNRGRKCSDPFDHAQDVTSDAIVRYLTTYEPTRGVPPVNYAHLLLGWEVRNHVGYFDNGQDRWRPGTCSIVPAHEAFTDRINDDTRAELPEPRDDLRATEARLELLELMSHLTPSQAQIFCLRVDAASFHKIAAIQGKNYEAVRRDYYRATQMLRELRKRR